jgi:hypothetical protein
VIAQPEKTFLGNCRELRTSKGYRQNIYICFNQDGHGAIFMDLDHKLYILVTSSLAVTPVENLDSRYSKLLVDVDEVRDRMDRESFILNNSSNDEVDYIFRIPSNPQESFAVDLFNELLDLNVKPQDVWYKWD